MDSPHAGDQQRRQQQLLPHHVLVGLYQCSSFPREGTQPRVPAGRIDDDRGTEHWHAQPECIAGGAAYMWMFGRMLRSNIGTRLADHEAWTVCAVDEHVCLSAPGAVMGMYC